MSTNPWAKGSRRRNVRNGRSLRFEQLECRRQLASVIEIPLGLTSSEISALVASHSAGDTILFQEGVYDVTDLLFSDSIHVYGIPGKTVLRAVSGHAAVFQGFEGVVYGLTFTGGTGDIGGGVIIVDSHIYLDHVTITGNSARIAAAGLAARNSDVTIVNSSVTDNHQGRTECVGCFNGSFAAIGAFDDSVLTVDNVRVTDNVAWSSYMVGGGAITAGQAVLATPPREVTVVNSVFEHNYADGGIGVGAGGAERVTLRNNLFHENGNGVFANYAAVIASGTEGGVYAIENNTFSNDERAILIGDSVVGASVQNNIMVAATTGISAPPQTIADYNLFFEVSNTHTGGVTPGAHDVTGDPSFRDASGGDFSVQDDSIAVAHGNPAVAYDNWNGDRNWIGKDGGTPNARLAPEMMSVSVERLMAFAYVLANSERELLPSVVPVPALDNLTYQQVLTIGASPIIDEDGFYVTARPRAGIDQKEMLLYRETASGVYERVTFADAQVSYGTEVDASALPPAARVLTRFNYGVPDLLVSGSFPVVYTNGGGSFYERANQIGGDTGTSTRPLGAHEAFSPGETFPAPLGVWVSVEPSGVAHILALFDSEAYTGVIELTVHGGTPTTVLSAATFYPRKVLDVEAGSESGLNAESSMILKAGDATATNNARDVEWVMAWFDNGEKIAYQVVNPSIPDQLNVEHLEAAAGASLVKYALLNVDRDPQHFSYFHQFGVRYEDRPSVIAEILSSSVPLELHVLTAGTTVESADNMATIVVPQTNLAPVSSWSQGIQLTIRRSVGNVEADADEAPQLSAPVTVAVQEGETVSFMLQGSDADFAAGYSETLQYLLVEGARPAMTLDPATGAFHWLTSENDRGQHQIVAVARDSFGKEARRTIDLVVHPYNHAPTAVHLSPAVVRQNVSGAPIGTLTTDDVDDGQTHSYSVSDSRFQVTGATLALKDGRFLTPLDGASIVVNVVATDSGGLPQSISQTVDVDIQPNPHPWTNELRPRDVNADGMVLPLDALLLINQLNDPTIIDTFHRLPAAKPAHPLFPFFDVTADGLLVPVDVLEIIGELNGLSGEAEGEPPLASPRGIPVLTDIALLDSAFVTKVDRTPIEDALPGLAPVVTEDKRGQPLIVARRASSTAVSPHLPDVRAVDLILTSRVTKERLARRDDLDDAVANWVASEGRDSKERPWE